MLINEDVRQYRKRYTHAYTKSVLQAPKRQTKHMPSNTSVGYSQGWGKFEFKSSASNDERQINHAVASAPQGFIGRNPLMLCVFALLIACLVSGIALVVQGFHQRSQVTALANLQAERDALRAELTRLTLEQSTLTSLDRVERLSQQVLGMRDPKASDIVVVNTASDNTIL